MKTVKFKDLPEKVQEFLKRNGTTYCSDGVVDLSWLHALPLWRCATDEERLAYAEWRYPKGTKFKRLIPDYETYICFGEPRLAIYDHQNNWIFDGDGVAIYDSDKNKWAEIIEEPFNLTDTGDFRSEPEFKAGEIVEVWNTDTETDLQPAKYRFFADGKHWVETCASDIVVNFKNIRKPDALTKAKQTLHNHIQSNSEKVKQDLDKMRALSNEFKAGDEVVLDGSDAKTVFTIIHIFNGMAWVKSESMMFGILVMLHRLRKSDPDKHLREIAKEIAMSFPTLIYCEETHFHEQSVEQMLIEALKKGKEL